MFLPCYPVVAGFWLPTYGSCFWSIGGCTTLHDQLLVSENCTLLIVGTIIIMDSANFFFELRVIPTALFVGNALCCFDARVQREGGGRHKGSLEGGTLCNTSCIQEHLLIDEVADRSRKCGRSWTSHTGHHRDTKNIDTQQIDDVKLCVCADLPINILLYCYCAVRTT